MNLDKKIYFIKIKICFVLHIYSGHISILLFIESKFAIKNQSYFTVNEGFFLN
jgi:hypothetical protein